MLFESKSPPLANDSIPGPLATISSMKNLSKLFPYWELIVYLY